MTTGVRGAIQMDRNTSRIKVLDAETAKRIAAGEVIDRPAAALRELLDNAIDSGATSITVEMAEGGIDSLRVVDDGSGMGREDLALSILPHATSKISTLDDLLSLSTLGFRGEALSSIAAVSRLAITSATSDGEAWRLESVPGGQIVLTPVAAQKGTAVQLSDLFASFPARKKFLKRGQAEAGVCKSVFIDKALAFPGLAFRLSSERGPLLILQRSSLLERVLGATSSKLGPELFRELLASGEGFKARIVAGLPAIYRTDRRHIQVFVNGRRVQEYGIAQALEYAYKGTLPGGAWPFVYAFIEVDPKLADFNIHPAKKEVRIKNLDDIRAGLIRAIRNYLGTQGRLASKPATDASVPGFPESGQSGNMLSGLFEAAERNRGYGQAEAVYTSSGRMPPASYGRSSQAFDHSEKSSWQTIADLARETRENPKTVQPRPETGGPTTAGIRGRSHFRYLGRALGVFIAFEDGDQLVLMDQHAAHERFLYEEIMSGRAVSQELLVPVVYEPESEEEDAYLAAHADALAQAGFRLVREGSAWVLEAAPAMLPEAMTGSIFELIRSRPDPTELIRETAAQAACKAAIKDGDELDETGAVALIQAAMELPEPRCPHGRPIWLRLSRDELFRAVRRIV
jgi:DNA mismatch repair protein MutL